MTAVAEASHEFVSSRHCADCKLTYHRRKHARQPSIPVIAEPHEYIAQKHCTECRRRYHREWQWANRRRSPVRSGPPVENLDREALAWAAGFYDGEGCFQVRDDSGSISMTIHQVDPRPLRRFHDAVLGLGNFRGPYRRPHRVNRQNHSDTYTWAVTNYEDVQHVIDWLWEFLSEPKREQIEKHMAVWNSRPRKTRGSHVSG